MSNAGNAKSIQEMGFDSLALGNNKSDYKKLDLGSPVSPLRTTGPITTSSSSSGSSGTLSGKTKSSETSSSPSLNRSRPGHRRSVSAGAPLIYSGKSSITSSNGANSASSSPSMNPLPTGNICPSRKFLKPGNNIISPKMTPTTRTDVLGSRAVNYGHGSIVRGGGSHPAKFPDGTTQQNGTELVNVMVKRAMGSLDPEEVKRAGNEVYKRGSFVEALGLYDRAISILPENAAYRSNRAAALVALGRLWEAVTECEEAVRLDPSFERAHKRLAFLYIRLGQMENARTHLYFSTDESDKLEFQKLKSLEKHLNQCAEARKLSDWKSVLSESDAAMAIGADSSPQLIACKAEAFLKLHQLENADSILSSIPKLDSYPPSCSRTKFFGMLGESYVLYIQAQVDMAFGRFENAVLAAGRACKIECNNTELTRVLNNVKMVAGARSHGNELFNSARFAEACTAYGDGLKYDSSNSVLYCNRAVCWSKLGLWEQSVRDCNQALKTLPNYTKALRRRAASNSKLEKWGDAVSDLEVLRRELPGDNEVAESLHQARVALKNSSRREGIRSMEMGGEVEEVTSLDKFKSSISFPGISVVHFKVSSADPSEEISSFMNTLCVRYSSAKFFKVDVEESLAIAKAEGIKTIPAFKIYKNGQRLVEMVRPSHKFLEDSIRNCIL